MLENQKTFLFETIWRAQLLPLNKYLQKISPRRFFVCLQFSRNYSLGRQKVFESDKSERNASQETFKPKNINNVQKLIF